MIVLFMKDDDIIFDYELKRIAKYSKQANRFAAIFLKYDVDK
jgi:hypothetical protein